MAEVNNPITEISKTLDSLLSNVDLTGVTSESSGFTDLPEGYYLCQVDDAKLTTSKSSGNPMVSFTFTVQEDGKQVVTDEDNNATLVKVKSSKGRKIFMHYVLKDERSIKRFASDMLKFEEEEGKSILSKEYFLNTETLNDALDLLVGMQIFVQITINKNQDGTSSTWQNLISWKRVSVLGL